MDRVRNLLEQIRNRLEELNKAEKKVAEVILLNPQQATRFSIAALAQAASVSEPTVNRFCRSFGVSGYPELKLQLAQSLASGAAYVSRAVEADDDPEAYTQKIFGSAIASLDSACQALDPNLISKAVDLLIQARQIHFFGLGASAPVAMDALHKFFRFNLSVTAHADVLMQRMIASVAHTGELFVIISYTGRTRELVEVARIARGKRRIGAGCDRRELAAGQGQHRESEHSAAGRHRHLYADDLADHPADGAGCTGNRHDLAPWRGLPAAPAQDQRELE
jgi:RpiR family carbohydrate utilization transcriptional regulator